MKCRAQVFFLLALIEAAVRLIPTFASEQGQVALRPVPNIPAAAPHARADVSPACLDPRARLAR